MGLDNGFKLKHKKKDDNNASSVGQSIEIPFEIAYFRKYFELDEWCTQDDLDKLWNTIEPIVKSLRALGDKKVLYYCTSRIASDVLDILEYNCDEEKKALPKSHSTAVGKLKNTY